MIAFQYSPLAVRIPSFQTLTTSTDPATPLFTSSVDSFRITLIILVGHGVLESCGKLTCTGANAGITDAITIVWCARLIGVWRTSLTTSTARIHLKSFAGILHG